MTDQAAPVERRRFGLVLGVAALVLAADQLTKVWAVSALSDRDVELVGSLRLHLVRNSGSAFSLNRGRGGLIAIFALFAVGWLLWFGRTAATRLGAVSIGLLLGGAAGNLVDRIARDGHAVVDFIDPQWWPVFNVSDIGVSIGAVLVVLGTFRE